MQHVAPRFRLIPPEFSTRANIKASHGTAGLGQQQETRGKADVEKSERRASNTHLPPIVMHQLRVARVDELQRIELTVVKSSRSAHASRRLPAAEIDHS
jgi:hypothetical protein